MADQDRRNLDSKALRAGLWYTVGNILFKGCVFISLPIFTRLLSLSDFGIYNTYIAYEQLLMAILGLGLYGTIKNAKLDFKNKFNEYLSSAVFLSLLFWGLILLMLNIFYPAYKDFFRYSRLVMNCLLAQSFGAFLLHFYGTKLNVEFSYGVYLFLSGTNIIGNILLSILLILNVFSNERYLGRILGSALPLILIAIFILVTVFRKGRTLYSKEYWSYAFRLGLPLIPHVVSQSLLAQFDRIMITNMSGDTWAGIYSCMYTISTVIYIVGQSLENAWTPWVYFMLEQKREDKIRAAGKKYVLVFTLLTIGFMCVSPEIVRFAAGREYWTGTTLLVPLIMGNYFSFLYTLPVGVEYFHKKTGYISIGTISAALLNIFLNYLGISLFGYRAAAYTTAISQLALFAFHWRKSVRLNIKRVYELHYLLKCVLVITGIGTGLLFISKYTVISTVIRYLIVLIISILLLLKRKLIIKAIRTKVC